MSLEEYIQLFDAQEGLCAVCLKAVEGNLYVDHDHVTGLVRGLLCRTCNLGLGHFKDDTKLLLKAVNYLTSKKVPFLRRVK